MPAITVAGDQILRGGQPWWFLGFNSFTWSDDCNGPGENMSVEDVDAWFSSMRHDGHGAVRLFFFPGWSVDRLDAAIASAKRNNIYVTVTLDNGIEGCGAEEKTAEWFSDPGKRAIYSEHLTMLLERYRGETAIAWFEYFNEPGYADGALREFYDEMGALADRIDPNRLFSSGTIATYALDGDENFRTVHESPGVDIASLHEYDADEVESHWGPEVIANADGKPVIVGEFGIYASETVPGIRATGSPARPPWPSGSSGCRRRPTSTSTPAGGTRVRWRGPGSPATGWTTASPAIWPTTCRSRRSCATPARTESPDPAARCTNCQAAAAPELARATVRLWLHPATPTVAPERM